MVRALASLCEYSPFSARMVKFCANMVNHGASNIFTLFISSFPFPRSGSSGIGDDAQDLRGGGD